MSDQPGQQSITSLAEFPKTDVGLQRMWTLEISAAKDNVKKWHSDGEETIRRYLDEREGPIRGRARLNLFHSNVITVLAILYGRLPQTDVSRRFGDSDDEIARIAGEMLERILNADIERGYEGFKDGLRYALLDWKLPGLGTLRSRYEIETEETPGKPAITGDDGQEKAPAVPAGEDLKYEDACSDYVHWKDFLWSPCKTWHDARWVAFKVEMTRDEAVSRFGEIGKTLPLQARRLKDGESSYDNKEIWSRVEVWEIWSKRDEVVYWFCEGASTILDKKDDPLELEGFWPCARPLFANTATSKLIPKPDFKLAQDLYDEIDDCTYRLNRMQSFTRVQGAYDAAFPDLARILEEADEGQLIPVKGWRDLNDKGGIEKSIAYLPIQAIVDAMQVLSLRRQEAISLLYQVTGLSDVIRGQASKVKTATETQTEAGFASTRLQIDQDEVARFASEHQCIRAEIICKHFRPETIIERSNVMQTADAQDVAGPDGQPMPGSGQQRVQQAVQFLKSNYWQYRIEVKADTIALQDYARLKQERVEAVQTLAGLFQQGVPMVQMYPQSAPFLLSIGKWLLASCRGSGELEVEFERFAAQAEAAANQPKPPPPPDPRLQAAQVKAQAEMGKAQADMQQTTMDAGLAQQKHQMDMQRLQVQAAADKMKTQNQLAIAAVKPREQL